MLASYYLLLKGEDMVCDQSHICKSCGHHRRLKLMEPCSDCFHNQKFIPVSGAGKCCWISKLEM